MAKPSGIIKFVGTLDEVSSYNSVYGPILRKKGGPSAEQIKESPQFERTRENNEEFKQCALAGKLWRQGLLIYTSASPDFTLVPRVTKLMHQLKELDHVSARGVRLPGKGLGSAEGRALMRNFELNSKAPLSTVLKTTYSYESGSFIVHDLVPKRDLRVAAGTSHVRLRLVVSLIDFKKGQHEVTEQQTTFLYDRSSQDVFLKPKALMGSGFNIAVLQISFLQEVNGELYPLENKSRNCLSVVGVE